MHYNKFAFPAKGCPYSRDTPFPVLFSASGASSSIFHSFILFFPFIPFLAGN
ncbi:MAG: hypothetical protein ACFFD4_24145 [Candidatus Odinarchaeota archaeon]